MPFDQLLFTAGFSLACGWFTFYFCMQLLISALAVILPRDDSDPKKGPRSGLRILTDHLTGVQYLQTSIKGPLVPRLDSTGYPITKSKKDK